MERYNRINLNGLFLICKNVIGYMVKKRSCNSKYCFNLWNCVSQNMISTEIQV